MVERLKEIFQTITLSYIFSTIFFEYRITMKKEIREFLNTGLLEQYVLGLLEPSESAEVEDYIQKYPEVRSVYQEIQDGINNMMAASAKPVPGGVKASIMEQIDSVPPMNSSSSAPKTSTFNWLPIAAGFALLFGTVSFFQWNNNQGKDQALATLERDFTAYKEACETRQLNYANLQKQLEFINHSETDKFLLKGNEKATDFQVIAYWNDFAKKSMLRINEMPQLPDNQCFQMWADVDGKMLNLGIINSTDDLFVDFKYLANAESLNVTIEPKGGSDHPTVVDLVANVFI